MFTQKKIKNDNSNSDLEINLPDALHFSDSEDSENEKSRKKYNPRGDKALHIAVREKNETLVMHLIADGRYSALEENLKKETPLSIASEYRFGVGYDIFLRLSVHAQNEILDISSDSLNLDIINKHNLNVIQDMAARFSGMLTSGLRMYVRSIINRDSLDLVKKVFSFVIGQDKTPERNREQLEIMRILYSTARTMDYPDVISTLKKIHNEDQNSHLHGIIGESIKEGEKILSGKGQAFNRELVKFRREKFLVIAANKKKPMDYEKEITDLKQRNIDLDRQKQESETRHTEEIRLLKEEMRLFKQDIVTMLRSQENKSIDNSTPVIMGEQKKSEWFGGFNMFTGDEKKEHLKSHKKVKGKVAHINSTSSRK